MMEWPHITTTLLFAPIQRRRVLWARFLRCADAWPGPPSSARVLPAQINHTSKCSTEKWKNGGKSVSRQFPSRFSFIWLHFVWLSTHFRSSKLLGHESHEFHFNGNYYAIDVVQWEPIWSQVNFPLSISVRKFKCVKVSASRSAPSFGVMDTSFPNQLVNFDA